MQQLLYKIKCSQTLDTYICTKSFLTEIVELPWKNYVVKMVEIGSCAFNLPLMGIPSHHPLYIIETSVNNNWTLCFVPWPVIKLVSLLTMKYKLWIIFILSFLSTLWLKLRNHSYTYTYSLSIFIHFQNENQHLIQTWSWFIFLFYWFRIRSSTSRFIQLYLLFIIIIMFINNIINVILIIIMILITIMIITNWLRVSFS